MAKVLVTGASGFIGSHLCEALVERGHEVNCLVRKTSRTAHLDSLGLRLVTGDVTDLDSLRRAVAGQEVVYHLAAQLRALRARRFYEVNEHGAANVAQACAEQPAPPVLVLVTSLAAAGPSPDGLPLTEDRPSRPISHYGRSKRAGELAASRCAAQVPITIVRPGIVFGQRDQGCLPMFRSIAWFRVHLVPVLPTLGASLIHARDLVELLILAAERGERLPPAGAEGPPGKGYYFAACDEHPTYFQLGRLIGEALGCRRFLVVLAPWPAVRLVGAVNELLGRVLRSPLALNMDKSREATAGCWFGSSQKASDQLGFRAGAPLVERLRETAQWYRQEGWL